MARHPLRVRSSAPGPNVCSKRSRTSSRSIPSVASASGSIVVAAGVPVSLLDDVRAAAVELQRVEAERLAARKGLRAAILAAYSEGIPVARIAREAGVSRPTLYRYLEAD
jgi:hypothetical protein